MQVDLTPTEIEVIENALEHYKDESRLAAEMFGGNYVLLNRSIIAVLEQFLLKTKKQKQ